MTCLALFQGSGGGVTSVWGTGSIPGLHCKTNSLGIQRQVPQSGKGLTCRHEALSSKGGTMEQIYHPSAGDPRRFLATQQNQQLTGSERLCFRTQGEGLS